VQGARTEQGARETAGDSPSQPGPSDEWAMPFNLEHIVQGASVD